MKFQPDYTMITDVLANRKPQRLPLYEHIIDPVVMEKVLGVKFKELQHGNAKDLRGFFESYCGFFKKMTYDTVSFEVAVTDILPGHGAILGRKPGPIQNRRDFEKYPWQRLPQLYWQDAEKRFTALREMMPKGMKAIGGIGNGVFEISEDLVGMEHLAYMQIDNPQLHAEIYQRIGDLMADLWKRFLKQFGDIFAVCRIGDDLGFKNGLLISPSTFQSHIIAPYRRIIDLIHSYGKPFLWHSCGCIFDIMDEMIELGIDAKHSNEVQIAPFDKWIELYGSRIALLGGFDVNLLCMENPDTIEQRVIEDGRRFRSKANGYALGSGNSIPDYVPVDGYLAMIEAAQRLRESEQSGTGISPVFSGIGVTLSHRERIKTIINGQPADRCGLWLGKPHKDSVSGLLDYFGCDCVESLRLHLNDDIRWICPQSYPDVYNDPSGRELFDSGLDRKKHSNPPLADCQEIEQVDDFPWPDPKYLDFTSCISDLKKVGDFYRLSGFWTCFYHNVMDLMGMEEYLVKMHTHPHIVEAITDRICQFYYQANELFFKEAGGLVDGFFYGNDFGTQLSLICCRDHFMRFIMPWFKQFTRQGHRHNLQVVLHSCGSIFEVIDDIIEAGVQCLHPLQALAANMDAETLSNNFKGRIAFLGGIDAQQLLTNGTPQMIRQEVRRVRELLGPNLIISPSHEAVLPDVLPQNIEALAMAAIES